MSESHGPYSIIDCCQRDIMAEGYEPPLNESERKYFRQLVNQLETTLHYQDNVHPMRISVGRVDALFLVRGMKIALQEDRRR